MNHYETIYLRTSVAGPTAARALAWQLSLSCKQGGTLFSTKYVINKISKYDILIKLFNALNIILINYINIYMFKR